MHEFKWHTPETAPEKSRPLLRDARDKLGFIPNLFAGMAESPTSLQAYLSLSGLYEKSSLSPVEQQVVLLTVSVENDCGFCVGVHTKISRDMVKVPVPVIEALRKGDKLPDAKLEALSTFTRGVVRDRGWLDDKAIQSFLAAGFSRAQLLDVLVGVSMKTLSNYANHIMKTTLNKEIEGDKWAKEDKKKAA